MNYSPLWHGAAGPFDEIILGAEIVLVLALVIMFFRSRGRKSVPPADTPADSSNDASGLEPR